MLQIGRQYPSDLSDQQWEVIRDLIPRARAGGRPRTTDLRRVINAVFYLSRSGCAWRYLPKDFPPWQTVYEYFSSWKAQGVWRKIHHVLRASARIRAGRHEVPSCLIVDSQSVKAPRGQDRAYDGFKRVRGRKRHILVDTLGFVHAVKVHAADRPDQREGHRLFSQIPKSWDSRIKCLLADQGYRGDFEEETDIRFGFLPSITRRENTGQGRKKTTAEKIAWRKSKTRLLFPKRWIVERTFAWFNHYRRLTKDYEAKPSTSECMIQVAMTQLMVRRLARRTQ